MPKWSKNCLVTLILVLASSLSPHYAEDMAEPMPDVLKNPVWDYPFWVSAGAAIGTDHQIRADLFHPGRLRSLTELLRQPETNGCVRIEEVYLDFVDLQPRDSVDSALETAELVIFGKITGASTGFDNGYPATLLRAEVLSLAKGNSPLRVVYFAWPVASFEFDGKHICKTDFRYAEVPEIGDEMIAFVKKTLPEDFPMLHLESPGDVILLRASKVDYPSTMKRSSSDDTSLLNPAGRSELLHALGIEEHQQ